MKDFLTQLQSKRRTWALTGVAGFIGSNILEILLKADQTVIGLDNFSTGFKDNLTDVKSSCTNAQWANFEMIEGDICEFNDCVRVSKGADVILHQAALGSVPRSIQDPLATHRANVDGFINMLWAAKQNKIKAFVYASSSSVYGDAPGLPKVEDKIGKPLSPYAASKYIDEIYAHTFGKSYGLPTIGLRYFNVFGRRQSPEGAYAAVIPRWIQAIQDGKTVEIYGDGETSRDFCYVNNAVQANLRAGLAEKADAWNQVYNVAVGQRTSLNQLYQILSREIPRLSGKNLSPKCEHRDFRPGDIQHSLANIEKAQQLFGYGPTHNLEQGLQDCLPWYLS